MLPGDGERSGVSVPGTTSTTPPKMRLGDNDTDEAPCPFAMLPLLLVLRQDIMCNTPMLCYRSAVPRWSSFLTLT